MQRGWKLRWRTAGAAAGVMLAVTAAHAQQATSDGGATADGTATTTTDQTATPPPTIAEPRLTIAPEEDPVPRRRKRKLVDDPYAPTGLRDGGLIFHPSLGIGAVATSNALQSASNPQADIGLNLKPAVSFESDWSRHALSGEASFSFLRYLHNPGIKADTGDASLTGRLDIRHDTFATVTAGYTLTQTGLGSSQIPANAVGTRADQTMSAGLGLTHDYGPMTTELRSGLAYNAFGDVKLSGGGTETNSDRNFLSPSLALRATYSDPPVFKPYVEAGLDRRLYDHTRDALGLKRSSTGAAVSAGLTIDDSPIWKGDIAVTYLRRFYDDPALGNIGALGLNGSLTWSPTELTNIVMGAGTSLVDNVGTTTAANREWTASLTVNHAVRDNILLHAAIGGSFQQVSGGSDDTYTAGFGLDWKLTPEFAWTAGYDVTWLNAAQSSRNYTDHRVSVGLVWTR